MQHFLKMHLTSHLSTLLPALVLTILFAITSARSLTKEKSSVQMCSSHMACAWAICPYPSIPGPAFPDEEDCLYIENKSCQCASRCQLTDLFEPGRANVKYEYRCMSPEVTREIFPMSWRLRQSAPVV